jgi:hypothetical protein
MQALRQTGRTTRLLADAKRLAAEGRAVYVVTATENLRRWMERMAGVDAQALGIRFETPASLKNAGLFFDWHTMSLRNAPPNSVVLVDHSAVETTFAAVLEMLHRYDSQHEEKNNA